MSLPSVGPAPDPRQVPGETQWGAAQIFHFEEMPADVTSATYRRSAIRGDSAMVCLNFFEPNNPPWPLHDHPFDQIAFILSGRMRVQLAEETFDVGSPAAIWIPKNMPHCLNILGDEPCLNLDVFGVPREDFLYMTRYQAPWSTVDGVAPADGRASSGVLRQTS